MTELEALRNKAIGYVWGRMDAHDETLWRIMKQFWEAYETWDISFLFSQAYAEHIEAGSGSYMSIQDAWGSWTTHGLIFSAWWEV